MHRGEKYSSFFAIAFLHNQLTLSSFVPVCSRNLHKIMKPMKIMFCVILWTRKSCQFLSDQSFRNTSPPEVNASQCQPHTDKSVCNQNAYAAVGRSSLGEILFCSVTPRHSVSPHVTLFHCGSHSVERSTRKMYLPSLLWDLQGHGDRLGHLHPTKRNKEGKREGLFWQFCSFNSCLVDKN